MTSGGAINHRDRGAKRIYGRLVPRWNCRSAAGPRPITIDDESINYYLPALRAFQFVSDANGSGTRFTLRRESDETPARRGDFTPPQINHRFGIPLLPRRISRAFRRWVEHRSKVKGIPTRGQSTKGWSRNEWFLHVEWSRCKNLTYFRTSFVDRRFLSFSIDTSLVGGAWTRVFQK